MTELTTEEKAALAGVEKQLVAVFGTDANGVINSIRNAANGVEPAQEQEPKYKFWGDTPYFFDETEGYYSEELANPEWEIKGTPVHDWQIYIPDGLIERWDTLSQETKEVAYYMAKEQADREVWD